MLNRKVVMMFVVVLVGAAIFSWWFTRRNFMAAIQLVTDVQKLNVGRTPFSEVQQLENKYERYVRLSSCNGDACRVSIVFGDSWLRAVGPRTGRGLTFDIVTQGGVLVSDEMNVAQDGCCIVHVDFRTLDEHASGNPKALFRDGTGRPWKVLVHLSSESSEAEKKTAYQFDLECFRSFRGCQSVSELFPSWDR